MRLTIRNIIKPTTRFMLYGLSLMMTLCVFSTLSACSHHDNDSKKVVAGLPDNYPINDVPILDGQVIDGKYEAADQSWSLSVLPQGNNIVPRAEKLILDKGFKRQAGDAAKAGTGVDVTLRYYSDKYFVTLAASTISDVPTVDYFVQVRTEHSTQSSITVQPNSPAPAPTSTSTAK